MKKYFSVLRKCALFCDIADEDLLRMLSCLGARVESFDKKYTIFAEGKPVRHVGIVLSGSAQAVQLDYYGNRSIVMGIGVGEVFGEAFACAEVPAIPVSIVANEPCEVMLIDCGHILHTCANHCSFHHQMIYNMMRDLAMKNLRFHHRVEITSKRSTRDKLLAYLLMFAKETGKDSFDIPFDRQELADFLEVDRSGLSAEIGKMKKEGLIECNKNHFVLL